MNRAKAMEAFVALLDALEEAEEEERPRREKPRKRSVGLTRYVYAIKCGSLVKIGTSENVLKRARTIQTAHTEPVCILAFWEPSIVDETDAHRRLREHHARGEWFHATPEVMLFVSEMLSRQSVADDARCVMGLGTVVLALREYNEALERRYVLSTKLGRPAKAGDRVPRG